MVTSQGSRFLWSSLVVLDNSLDLVLSVIVSGIKAWCLAKENAGVRSKDLLM